MTEPKFKYNKRFLWTLKITLFIFSVFAFAGYNEKLESVFQKSTPTEFVFSKNSTKVKGIKFFKKAFNKSVLVKYSTNLKNTQHFAQANYNQVLQVKFKDLSKKILSYQSSFSFLQTRIILPLSNDDIPNFLV